MSSMTSSWIRVESTSRTTRRAPRRASPAGATAMSAPTCAETRARARRSPGTSAPETSSSTVVTGQRESRRIRSMLAPCSATARATSATWRLWSGAAMTTTAARPVRRGALSPRPATSSTCIPIRSPARVRRSVRTFSSGPGERSTERARWPRTTTCSRSSTSAPTVVAASNSALVTPGRSGPVSVTSRVRASGSGSGGGVAEDTPAGYAGPGTRRTARRAGHPPWVTARPPGPCRSR